MLMHRDILIIPQRVKMICCWRQVAFQRDLQFGKGTLFDLLLTDILHNIDMWLVGLEHQEKPNGVMAQINRPQNTVLFVEINQGWKCTVLLGNLSNYHSTKSE